MKDYMMVQRKKAMTPTFTPLKRDFILQPSVVPQVVNTSSSLQKASSSSSQHELPNLQTQLERAARFGHNFGRIKVHPDKPAAIQPKLTIGQPGDKYEQEADRVAAQVVAMPTPKGQQEIQRQNAEQEELQTKPVAVSITPTIQLQGIEEEEVLQTKSLETTAKPDIQCEATEKEEVQAKFLGATDANIQREATEEEELQTKPSLQTENDGNQTSQSLASRLATQKGGGSPLSNEVRSFMEPRFGADFGQVRIHTSHESIQMNRELNAQAFTHGRDIYFGTGKYNPGSNDGKQLLAHELTHVIQQTGKIQLKPGDSQSEVNKVMLPASLRSDIGKVDYYLFRLRDYNKRHINPPAPDYYLNYGDKYARRFTTVLKSQLSSKGQAWVDKTFVLLQQAIENKRDVEPKAFDLLEQKADKFKTFAYETHSKAYLDGGLGDLTIRDLWNIGTTPDLGDILTYSGISQVVETGSELFKHWGVKGGDWLIDKAKQMMSQKGDQKPDSQ